MYARDMPLLKAHAEASPEGLADVITFTLLSIRQPFATVERAMRDVRVNGAESVYLWGWKREGFEYAWDNAHHLYFQCIARQPGAVDCIDALATLVPGLGIVKGAFVAQMLGHNVACFDTRNLAALEIDPRTFREFKRREGKCVVRYETRARRIADYVQMTIETGGAAHWWDLWCHALAPQFAGEADAVSAKHVEIITREKPRRVRGRLPEYAPTAEEVPF